MQHEASLMVLLVTVYLIVCVAVAECVYNWQYMFYFHVYFSISCSFYCIYRSYFSREFELNSLVVAGKLKCSTPMPVIIITSHLYFSYLCIGYCVSNWITKPWIDVQDEAVTKICILYFTVLNIRNMSCIARHQAVSAVFLNVWTVRNVTLCYWAISCWCFGWFVDLQIWTETVWNMKGS